MEEKIATTLAEATKNEKDTKDAEQRIVDDEKLIEEANKLAF